MGYACPDAGCRQAGEPEGLKQEGEAFLGFYPARDPCQTGGEAQRLSQIQRADEDVVVLSEGRDVAENVAGDLGTVD